MILQKQTLLVSSSSIFVLLMAAMLSFYLYKSQIRPELVDPESYEKVINSKLSHLNSELLSVRQKYSKLLYVPVPNFDAMTSGAETVFEKAKAITSAEKTDAEPEISLADSSETASTIKEEIAEFKLPSQQENQSKNIQHELKVVEVDPTDLPSSTPNTVTYGLLGLKLETPNLTAAVYKIKNIFGDPDRIGHYFVIDKTSSLNLQPENIDFSGLETFKKTTSHNYETTEDVLNENWTLVLSMPSDNSAIEKIKEAIIPTMSSNRFLLNPYKWLYLATSYVKDASFKPFSALLISSSGSTQKVITYPVDISVVPQNFLNGKMDKTVYTANLKRTLNHCRDSIGPEIAF